MKKVISMLLVLVMVLGIAGCSGSGNSSSAPADNSTPAGTSTPADASKAVDYSDKLVCLISEVPKGAPFTDLTWRGFEKLEADMGCQVKLVEAMDKAEYIEQIRSMAQLGASPIYGMFDAVCEAMVEVAPEFPETKFYLIDSYIEAGLDNVCGLIVDPYEASFVAGFVAAKTTETKKIAWIGHSDAPTINRFRDGYVAGAKLADPTVEVASSYIGDANDPTKGKEVANIAIDGGADVVFQVGNQSGLGVIKACDEKGVKCIGVDDWQGDLGPSVFWSALKDIDGAIYSTGKDVLEGKFTAGQVQFNIGTGSKAYDQRDFDKLPADLQKEVAQLMEDIASGKVDVFAK